MRRAGAPPGERAPPRASAAGAPGARVGSSRGRSKAGRERRSCARRAKYPATASTTRTIRTMTNQCTTAPLQHDVARAQVRADLALDALERVVDGLAVASQ